MTDIESLVQGIHDRRVLVVDDCGFVAEYISEGLRKVFPVVDHVSSPLEAIDLILESARKDLAYQSLVTDLDMPVMNGIQLLKDLSRRGIHLPTVIHSGEQGDYLAARLLNQVSKVTTREELDAVVEGIERGSFGIPIAYVKKLEGPIGELVNAIDATTMISQRRGMDLDRFFSMFSVREEKYHFCNNHMAQLADLVKLSRERFIGFRAELDKFASSMTPRKKADVFYALDTHICVLSSDGFSLNSLCDPEYGRARIHSLQGAFKRHFLDYLFKEQLGDPAGWLSEGCDSPETTGPLVDLFNGFEAAQRLLGNSFEYHRYMSKDYLVKATVRIGLQLMGMEDFSKQKGWAEDVLFEHGPIDEGLKVETSQELINFIFQNVLSNAIDAVYGCPSKRIYLEVKRVEVQDLRKDYQGFFSRNHIPDNGAVAQVLIRDSGCGIPTENLDRITEEGFSTKMSTGFGLSFVDQKIKEVPGFYRIESEVGKGTDFYLFFPLK